MYKSSLHLSNGLIAKQKACKDNEMLIAGHEITLNPLSSLHSDFSLNVV